MKRSFLIFSLLLLAASVILILYQGPVYVILAIILSQGLLFIFHNTLLLRNLKQMVFEFKLENKGEILKTIQLGFRKSQHALQSLTSAIRDIADGKQLNLAPGNADEGLIYLQHKLDTMRSEEKLRLWDIEGLSKISQVRNNDGDIKVYGEHVISLLIKYLNANQGRFFVLTEDEEPYLSAIATYAYGKRKISSEELKIFPGQGLLGQTFLEGEMVLLTQVPPDYIKITSGLGEATPGCVLIVPLKYKERVYGIIEIASFHILQDHEKNFLQKAAALIGNELYAMKVYSDTRKLLDRAELMSSELRNKETEMRRAMQEMQMTQEEMGKKQAELNGVFASINRAMGAAEFSLDGTVISINSWLANLLSAHGQNHSSKDLKWFCVDPKRFSRVRESMIRKESINEEYSFQMDNKTIWINAIFNPVEYSNNNISKILMLVQDITLKKEREKEFETLSLVADNTDNSVIITDCKGKILYINPGFIKMTGYSVEECLGKKPGDFLQGAQTDKEVTIRISQKLKNHEPICEELLNYKKDGTQYWISMVINPVRDQSGEVHKYISIQTDITETKERALDFHHKLDSISRTNALIEFDAFGRIKDVNDFFLKVTEFQKPDLIGKSYESLIPDSEKTKPQIIVMWHNLLVGQSFTGEFKCIDALGRTQWICGTYNPIFDLQRKLTKIIMLGQFVTEDRGKQLELKQYVNVLKQSFPILEINNQLQFKSCNDKFLTIANLKRIEFNRKKLNEIFTDDSVIEIVNIIRSNTEDSFHSVNLCVKNGNDPHLFAANVSLMRDQSSQLLRAIIVLKKEEVMAYDRSFKF